jgi:hypothetical protein
MANTLAKTLDTVAIMAIPTINQRPYIPKAGFAASARE